MLPNYFSDSELEVLERNDEYLRRGNTCPVCLGDGEYFYQGERFECPDDDYGHPMLRLAKFYWLHNIPLQYQTLLWTEWPHKDVVSDIENYVTHQRRFILNGMGMTFYGSGLATGKTWAASHIARVLTRLGIDVWWANFYEVKSYYEIADKDEKQFKIKRVQGAEVLILDEVKKPDSIAQRNFFEDKLEDLLRPRTNANFPTIITTNMLPADWEKEFPRAYSLMMAKNATIELKGADARISGPVFQNLYQLSMQGETRPIT